LSAWLASLATARLVELAMLLVVVEAAALGLYRVVTGRGIPPADAWPNLASGMLLMGACRAALRGESAALPLWLGAALVAHVYDLRRRWRR
jgi:hypothetical protein